MSVCQSVRWRVKKIFPIDPAILAAIGHRFIAKQNKKIKNGDARVWGDARGDQKPETFFRINSN